MDKYTFVTTPSTTDEPALHGPDLADPSLYLNRELSWIEFNRRVLEESHDSRHPLLERVKFLSIFGSNMDEFFMIRVSGLKDQIAAGVTNTPPDGLTPARQLQEIRTRVLPQMVDQRSYFQNQLLPELSAAGIYLLRHDQLDDSDKDWLRQFFQEEIFPVLTPLAVDPGRPFPHISNLSLNLAVMVRHPRGDVRFARLKVPTSLPRLVPLPGGQRFVWLEDVIAANLGTLFPGLQVIEAFAFRVTRDADMEIQEDEASDLLETIELSLRKRHFGPVVRLQVDAAMSDRMLHLLMRNLEVEPADVYALSHPLGLSDLMSLLDLDRPELKDPPFVPSTPPQFRDLKTSDDVFNAIRKGDILLHHPYDNFTPVLEFIRAAAADPKVLAIKQTLYRVGQNAPVVRALLEAQKNGKQVAVLVELKARFDEESNIGWARALEAEGVHVVYGLLGLKTHSKVTLVVRKEQAGLRRYLHLATGNYNAVTAGTYTDLGMLTADPELGADATDLFNTLTGFSTQTNYRGLLVAPHAMRERLEALIEREIEHRRAGGKARLILKMNALVDDQLIRALYRASQAGVPVDLIVRGICCLRPGIKGVSDNIRVISIVGRFLEHSRIYYFENDGDPQIYMGSADLMPRNLDRRVETLFPVRDRKMKTYIRNAILAVELRNNTCAHELLPDGSYLRLSPQPGEEVVDSQAWLLAHPSAGGTGDWFEEPDK